VLLFNSDWLRFLYSVAAVLKLIIVSNCTVCLQFICLAITL